MKKLLLLAVCLALLIAFNGCSKSDSGSSGKSSPSPPSGPPPGGPGGPPGGSPGGPYGKSPMPGGPPGMTGGPTAPGSPDAAKAEVKPAPKPFDDHSDDPWYPPEDAAAKPGAPAKSDHLAAVGKKLVGVWKGKPTPQDEKKKVDPMADMPVTVEFKDGGAMSMNVAIFTLNGTWDVLTAEGNNVSIKTVMEMPDLSFGMEKGKEKVDLKSNKDTKDFSIVFLTDDRITMAPKDEPKNLATLDRQKK